MKKKNILFQTAVVACLLFGTGINMSSCIEQTFPKSSTAISEQIAESPAAMNAMLNAVVGFVNAYNTYGQGYTWDLGYTSYGIIREVMCEDFIYINLVMIIIILSDCAVAWLIIQR